PRRLSRRPRGHVARGIVAVNQSMCLPPTAGNPMPSASVRKGSKDTTGPARKRKRPWQDAEIPWSPTLEATRLPRLQPWPRQGPCRSRRARPLASLNRMDPWSWLMHRLLNSRRVELLLGSLLLSTFLAANLYFGQGFTTSAWFQSRDTLFAGNSPLYSLCLYPWIRVFGFDVV